jgi:hypothetical protein
MPNERMTAVFSMPVPKGEDELKPYEFNHEALFPWYQQLNELGAMKGSLIMHPNTTLARVVGKGFWTYIIQWNPIQ